MNRVIDKVVDKVMDKVIDKKMDTVIELKSVTKYFDDKLIFKNLDLKIKRNMITAIMASSGYGKTTLARLICGLDNKYTGCIEIFEDNEDKDTCMMFQEDRLIENISLYKNLKLVSNDDDKIKEYIRAFELTTYMDKKVSELSGGTKRRVALVRCLLTDKKIFVLDEPFNGLDEIIKDRIITYLKKYQKENNKTIIIITHNKEDAKKLASTIIEIDKIR